MVLMSNRKGFTVIELLVVLGIIAILVLALVPKYTQVRNRAKEIEVKAGVSQIQRYLEEFAVDNNGLYPGIQYQIQRDPNGNPTQIEYQENGVLGAVNPNINVIELRFTVDPASHILDPGTPQQRYEVSYVDMLYPYLKNGQYPSNPFLRGSGLGNEAQMSNLFRSYSPNYRQMGVYDWNRYSTVRFRTIPGAQDTTHRSIYEDYGRGHFTYLPFGAIYGDVSIVSDPNTPLEDVLKLYHLVRDYWLIGWGVTRKDETLSKGISAKYFNASAPKFPAFGPPGGFDLNRDLEIDIIEQVIPGVGRPEMYEVKPNVRPPSGAFFNSNYIDHIFDGATIILRSGESN